MAFGGFDKQGATRPMAEINMIPLIDVMLVLLVIFIVTAPLLTHAIKVDLPKVAARASVSSTETVTLDLRADGALFWNGEAIPEQALGARLAEAAARATAVLHIRADAEATYQQLARVMAEAQGAGVTQIGLVVAPGGRTPRAEKRMGEAR
jgi:biopolymer transport protein ExbD